MSAEGRSSEEEQRIISDSGFIESIRDFGLTTLDAVKELVDNSLDAGADTIWITVGENSDGRMYLIVEDNGEGIPKEQVTQALAFGGRLPWRSSTIGEYGFGLPSSACCQSSTAEVYSTTVGNDEYAYNYIDINELKENKGTLPQTTTKSLPSDKYDLELNEDTESGAIIIFTELIRPQFSTVRGMKRNIKEDLAEFHRNFLAADRDIYVNGDEVQFSDPLMIMEGSEAVDECGNSEDYGEIEPIVFENVGEDGEAAQVEITLAKLPIRNILENGLQSKYNIGRATQGFYLVRNGRQIAGGRSLQLYTKTNHYNYFRGEIRFSPELDEKFGVQTNKSRFSLDPELREKLNDRLDAVLKSIKSEIMDKRSTVKSEMQETQVGTEATSEKIANKALDRLPPSDYTPSEEELEDLEEEKEQKIREVEDSDLDEAEKDERIETIRRQFQRDKTINRVIDVLGSGFFYDMTHKGNQMDVSINRDHPFYKQVYQRAMEEDPELQVFLDLIIFSLAQAEDQYYTKDKVRRFYNQQRREWSSIMAAFLEETSDEFDN